MKWNVDEERYKKACLDITKSDLKDFKRHPDYIAYVGNDVRKYDVAKNFYDYIKRYYVWLMEHLPKILSNDTIGNPVVHDLGEHKASAGTLRFAKVVGDLEKFFGSLDGLNIVEIGSGYGGQCKVIHDVYEPKFYSLVDIFESTRLAFRYLNKFGLLNKIRTITPKKLLDESVYCDLVISDYALSEFDDELVDFYIKEIIKDSKYGYFTVNIFNQGKLDKFVEKLRDIYKDVLVLKEMPKTSHHDNHIIICKNGK